MTFSVFFICVPSLFFMSHSTLQLGSLYLLYAKVGHVDSVKFLELQTFEYVFSENIVEG